LIFGEKRRRFEQPVDAPALHEVLADESGEDEQAFDAVLECVGHAQEEESNQRDGDLKTHRVLGCAEEVTDFKGVFDPAEEQLDLPTPLIELGNLLCRGVEIVGKCSRCRRIHVMHPVH
jgi:hypothetical protein